MSASILTLTNLRKRFADTIAIDGVSCEIDQPCIFGVVGPDGAGKTTLLRILVGLLEFEAEQASVLGYDLATQTQAIKARLGYVPQTFSLYGDLTVQHNLEFFSDIHGLSRREFRARAAELLAIAQLDRFAGFLASSLSGGMKQKLALICALLHRPQLLILDEPNNGVDLIARGEMWAILRQLQDVTVVMSTGYLDEAERCDQVAYLYHGRIRVQGSPQDIKAGFPWKAYRLLGLIPAPVLDRVRHASWARRVREIGDVVTMETALSRAEVQQELYTCGGTDVLVEALTPTLEMAFTELTEVAEREVTGASVPVTA